MAEEEDDDDDDEQLESVSRSPSIRPESPAETEDSARSCSVLSTCGKKRRRPLAHIIVPQLKGTDFWSMVDQWFTARMQPDQLGTSWRTLGWKQYAHFILILLLYCLHEGLDTSKRQSNKTVQSSSLSLL